MRFLSIMSLVLICFASSAEALTRACEPELSRVYEWAQVYDSAIGYGRSIPEARDASRKVRSLLGLQVYLTLSTPTYLSSHEQAIEACRKLTNHFAFQIYLTARTPSYRLSHDQALNAALTLKSQASFQMFLHLLTTGIAPIEALRIAVAAS